MSEISPPILKRILLFTSLPQQNGWLKSSQMAVSVTLIALALSSWCIYFTNAASAPAIPHSYLAYANVFVNGQHVCGGTILTREWVLTAAHCLIGAKYKDVEVYVGDHLLSSVEKPEQKVKTKQFIIHQKYDKSNLLHDIAVILVYPPIEFNNQITCTNTPYCNVTEYEEGVVVGHSKWDFENGQPSDELMEGTVKIISGEECKKKVPQISKPKYVVCAEGDTCAGDTGGPLFLKKPYHVEQVGVTSYSYEGCEKGVTVYTKLNEYAGWLHRRTAGCGNFPFYPELHERK